MNTEFLPNNSHWLSTNDFFKTDPHLYRLIDQPYIFHSPIIDALPTNIPGIFNLGGARQVGKTTLLKQWMQRLITLGTDPQAIAFLSCELIVDEHSLYRIVTETLTDMPSSPYRYLILDEITYVLNWDKAIKYLADTNAFENVIVVISGSDLIMMQEARQRFPGRRGLADQVDFHFYPLTFLQTIELKNIDPDDISALYSAFDEYLIHGGFLTAMNDYAKTQRINIRTLSTYSDWIRGDFIKRHKKEYYLREISSAIIKHYASQISWRNLTSAMTIDHVQTAIDYVSLLESLDALFIQQALVEDKLTGAPKKPRKLMFSDPFIYHALNTWLNPTNNPYEQQILPNLKDTQLCGQLVEAVVVTHFRQHYPTYYIKAAGEIDIAYIKEGNFWPIEIKWTNQLRPADLKQILKYPQGQIWAKCHTPSNVNKIPVLPLPAALLTIKE